MKILGIDLGTTNVCVAIMEAGKPIVIPNLEGKRITPAVVAFLKDGECIVGEQAKGQGVLNPQTTIHSTKRFLGFELNEFNREINQFSYKIAKGIHNLTSVEVNGSSYTPQEISAIILKKIKKAAEAYLGHEVTEAIITVPALFNDIQRTATKEAGQIAGLNVRRIINEPTAAALAYGMHKKRSNEKIAVFHLGGGSVDISILELQVINGESMFEVTATNGIVNLGGDDFDRVIVDWLAEEFMRKYPGIDLRKDPLSLKRLQAAAENAKIELSSTTSTMINLPYIHQNSTGFIDLECTLSRDKFEMLAENLFSKCIECCRQALLVAQLEVEEIHEVILVGGGTRMPKIQELLKAFFKKAPNKSVNPDEAVALGAAIQGGILAQELKDHLLLDVLPLSLGMETQGGRFTMIIPANTTIPTKKTMSFTAILKDQKALELKIYQGERTVARENKCIGQLYIPVLQLSSKSELEIKIVFNVDADGILDVSVLDRMTEHTYSTKISTFTGLSQSYLNQIKSEPKLIQGPSKSFEPEINNSFTDEPTNQQQENNFAEDVELIRTVYDRPLVEFFTNKDTIKIGKGYHLLNNHRSGDFTIKLVKIDDSSLFFGLIIDDKEGTLSTIEGILNESTIKFTKTYHQMQFPVNQKYIVIDEKRFIEYEGNLSRFSDRITGTWHEKKNVVKHQGLTHGIPAQYGTWECEKLSNQIVKTEEERHAFLQMIEDIKSNAIPEKKEETTGNKWTYSEILRLIFLIIAVLIWLIWSNS